LKTSKGLIWTNS